MAKQYISFTSAFSRPEYSIADVKFCGQVEDNAGYALGIATDDEGDNFLFRAHPESIGESDDNDAYERVAYALTIEGVDNKTIAAQLRELADYLDKQ